MTAPTTYTELGRILTLLGFLAREQRRARGLSLRAAAKEIGVSFSTLDRIEGGENAQIDSALAILKWLDRSVKS